MTKMIDPELANQVVRLALEGGATGAECTLAEGEEFSAQVRMRALETLKDADIGVLPVPAGG